MTVETYLYLCKQVGLSIQEMDHYMTIGTCLDYIEEYIEQNMKNEKETTKGRRATQEDINKFF